MQVLANFRGKNGDRQGLGKEIRSAVLEKPQKLLFLLPASVL